MQSFSLGCYGASLKWTFLRTGCRMTQIDRYLLIIYFRVLAICFLSITGLIVIVQLFNNLTEFMENGQKGQGLLMVLIGYFGPYVLTLFDQLSGLLTLMAVLFAITWINRTNELTALLAAGITKRRILRPLMIASACVIGSAAIVREVWIPQFQDRLECNPQDLKADVTRSVRATHDPKLCVLLDAKNLSPSKRELSFPVVRIQPGPLVCIGRQVLATVAKPQPADDNHPQGFLLQNVSMPRAIDTIASVRTEQGDPLLLTRSDCPWLAPGECFLASDIGFEMLRGGSSWKKYASTAELIQHVQLGNAPNIDDVRVQIHSRFVRPAVDWTVLLLGIPIVLTRPDRNMFWVAGVAMLVVGGFMVIVMGMNAAGASGFYLSPLVAAWLPVLLVLPWGYQKTAAAFES